MTTRKILKLIMERGARWSGMTTVARWRRRADVLVLAYHNIVPTGEKRSGDLSLHLPQKTFAEQLDALAETHDVVPLDALLNQSSTLDTRPTRPRAAITFDDAYRGTVIAGVDELRKRGFPGTIFVAPKFVDGGTFWWDRLSTKDGLDADVREYALNVHAGRHDDIMEWAQQKSIRVHDVPHHMTCASELELHSAVASLGITLGSHSWSHANLAQLDSEELLRELLTTPVWLRDRFGGKVLNAITYPYGRASERMWDATRVTGYAAGYMIQGGWHSADDDSSTPFTRPRLNVPAGLTSDGFVLRASGVILGE